MDRAPFPWGFAGSDVLECTHVQIQLHGFSCETRARSVRAQTDTCQTGAMEDFVRTLKTSEAAAVLNVSPNTLRAWERRFGYPKPQRTAGKHRLYTHGEIAALHECVVRLEAQVAEGVAIAVADVTAGARRADRTRLLEDGTDLSGIERRIFELLVACAADESERQESEDASASHDAIL